MFDQAQGGQGGWSAVRSDPELPNPSHRRIIATRLDRNEPPDIEALLELLHRPAWHRDAACKEASPAVSWFAALPDGQAAAKAVCAGCLVIGECRAWALAQGRGLQGIWAGMSEAERARIRRSRPAA